MDKRDMDRAITILKKRIGPQMVGWSGKIRDGRVRIYVTEMPTCSAEVDQVEVAGQRFGVEYVPVGEIRVLR
ncbi:MAG: hypothetical protein QW390_04255 [Candidatus Bathyarchaeia archaeon]